MLPPALIKGVRAREKWAPGHWSEKKRKQTWPLEYPVPLKMLVKLNVTYALLNSFRSQNNYNSKMCLLNIILLKIKIVHVPTAFSKNPDTVSKQIYSNLMIVSWCRPLRICFQFRKTKDKYIKCISLTMLFAMIKQHLFWLADRRLRSD